MNQPELIAKETRRAVFSPCRRYRYTLRIVWNQENSTLVQFIGLNPSTADEFKDDNTVRRCKDFARRWGYNGIVMTNIFAWRDTLPEKMKSAADPIGPENDAWLVRAASEAALCVGAWGSHGSHLNRSAAVRAMLPPLWCLGRTASGEPRHPLYLRRDAVPVRME